MPVFKMVLSYESKTGVGYNLRVSVWGDTGTIGIVALMCEKTIGIVDGGGCAGVPHCRV